MLVKVSKTFIIGWVTCQILIGLVGETSAEDLVLLRHSPDRHIGLIHSCTVSLPNI
jgi:hypothetical protein